MCSYGIVILLLDAAFASRSFFSFSRKTQEKNCFLPSTLKKVAVVEIYELTEVFGKMGRLYGFL